jgi:hypothetical protein
LTRILAILLLSVHLFNTAGYTFLFKYLSEESSREVVAQIEAKNYIEAELVELKVRLNLPYQSSMSDYESHAGQITINGNHHNYVKRKIANDTLYLLCLPNREKDKLQLAETNFSKDANDFDGSGKQESSVKKSSVFNQFQIKFQDYTLVAPLIDADSKGATIEVVLPVTYIKIPGKPPRVNS